jgi:hypothetical protein
MVRAVLIGRCLQKIGEVLDLPEIWYGLLPSIAGYFLFLSWKDEIVAAVRGEPVKRGFRYRAMLGVAAGTVVAIRALASGNQVTEMASLRGAAVEMRSLINETTEQSEIRAQQTAVRDREASKQQEILLLLTKWLVVLAGLTLLAAVVTLVAATTQ